MNMWKRSAIAGILILVLVFTGSAAAQNRNASRDPERILVGTMQTISSNTLFEYVSELASDKYTGRLTGTEGYNMSADWLISYLKKWGVEPAGDNGTYLQAFPNPYTLIFPDCDAYLHIPSGETVYKKHYKYYDEYIPGSTSGSGEVTAEVVYVGYGITASELGFDEYKDVDVRGKIVLVERESPVGPNAGKETFLKWRPYSFHQYKLENAVRHGARGMIYNYGPIGNPNNSYDRDFIYTHVGRAVVEDVFMGTGRIHRETVDKIGSDLKPQSFATGKTFTIKNTTEHHPDGTGYNVIGKIEGSDPVMKNEIIMFGGHLDHLGACYDIMPGANDNASAVAIMMEIADKIMQCSIKPRRTIVFNFFGAEEQAVAGSKYYLEHPVYPLEKTVGLINIDGAGCGERLGATAGRNFPSFMSYFEKYNEKYIHRQLRSNFFGNLARPRLDAARFMWKDIPSLTFNSSGANTHYHTPGDNIDIINEEIMEDLAQLLFIAVMDMANQDELDFRKDALESGFDQRN
ncbi:M28 family peptidase [candidate division KSB1 bacterium]